MSGITEPKWYASDSRYYGNVSVICVRNSLLYCYISLPTCSISKALPTHVFLYCMHLLDDISRSNATPSCLCSGKILSRIKTLCMWSPLSSVVTRIAQNIAAFLNHFFFFLAILLDLTFASNRPMSSMGPTGQLNPNQNVQLNPCKLL